MWNTIRKPLGITVGTIALLSLLYFLLIFQTRQQKVLEAKAFVDYAIPEIAKTWNPDELRRFSSAELISKNKELEETLVAINDKLGTLKRYGGSSVKGTATDKSGKYTRTFIVFEVTVECEDGTAQLDTAVTWQEGGWRLTNFFVKDARLRKPQSAE